MATPAPLEYAIWILGAYLVGSIPFGYLIGRCRGVDVRTVGSKNIGATNVYRTVGKKWGLLAFACDFLKGFAPAFAATRLYGPEALPVLVGFTSVLGHTFTVFMRFRGGKGVATAFGMLVALLTVPVLIAFAVFVAAVAVTHYISVGSCLAALTVAALAWVFDATLLLRVLATVLGVFVVFKHKSNIRRLIDGCENKIW